MRKKLLGGADRQRRFPDQQPDFEVGPLLGQAQQQSADLVGLAALDAAVGREARARIETPAQQQDGTPGLQERVVGGAEIGLAVHEPRHARGPGRSPAGVIAPELIHQFKPCLALR